MTNYSGFTANLAPIKAVQIFEQQSMKEALLFFT